MQPIARRCLSNLHTPDYGTAVQHHVQAWSGFQGILQGSNFYPKPIPRDLYYCPQRAPAQANHRRCSCKALIANYASFGGLSIFHYDYQRNQTSIEEIRKLQPYTCLMKDLMVWQSDVFEVRTNCVVLVIGDR